MNGEGPGGGTNALGSGGSYGGSGQGEAVRFSTEMLI